MKELIIVAVSKNTADAFRKQLYRLLGGRVNIGHYYAEGHLPSVIKADMVLCASQEAYLRVKPHLSEPGAALIARRSINYHEVGKLFEIPAGTDVLLVNDMRSSAYQTILHLQTLGIDHINYHPCTPDMQEYPRLAVAVTPGERQLVPEFVEKIVDIKTRLIDISTLVELLLRLGLLEIYADFLSADYVRDIIRLIKEGAEIRRTEESARRKLLKGQKVTRYDFSHIIGESRAIRSTMEIAEKMARSNSTILLQGESGTGKELIAQGIHNASPRRGGPFIAVNFAALTENLLESELFGYVAGAFTGAARNGAPGLFEEAHRGTIFLDEIGDAPLPFQVKLLRVLQERQIRRVGSASIIPVDVRVIVATNRDLRELIARGLFRRDLYYRLNVLPIKVPALRERSEDILPLAYGFYQSDFRGRTGLSAEAYFREVAPHLLCYDWPGNIRELQNIVEYLANICPEAPPLPTHLPEELRQSAILSWTENEEVFCGKVYDEIAAANRQDGSIGRRSLAEKLGVPENKIRGAVRRLCEEERVIMQKGRKGLKINPSHPPTGR